MLLLCQGYCTSIERQEGASQLHHEGPRFLIQRLVQWLRTVTSREKTQGDLNPCQLHQDIGLPEQQRGHRGQVRNICKEWLLLPALPTEVTSFPMHSFPLLFFHPLSILPPSHLSLLTTLPAPGVQHIVLPGPGKSLFG